MTDRFVVHGRTMRHLQKTLSGTTMEATVDAGVLKPVVARRALGMACSGVVMESIWPTNSDRAPELMEAYGVDDPQASAEREAAPVMGT